MVATGPKKPASAGGSDKPVNISLGDGPGGENRAPLGHEPPPPAPRLRSVSLRGSTLYRSPPL